jgi:hypothetical protein
VASLAKGDTILKFSGNFGTRQKVTNDLEELVEDTIVLGKLFV